MRAFYLALAFCAVPGAAMSPDREAIESDLIPQVQFVGEDVDYPSVAERQAELGVDYASVTVWRDGKIDWSAAYGEGITPDTRFQSASLSKAVASVAIVALAAERGFSLDADISPVLGQSLDLSVTNPDGIPITLRGLLSHTAGATVGGFPGYENGADIPSLVDVVTGKGNTDAVIIEAAQAGKYRYSGGGYELAELWAETVSGEDFDVTVGRLVLAPVGMTRSTFAPLERGLPLADVAPAQNGDGSPVPGGWNDYPEQAAASLWTTTPDYARFVGAYMAALKGEDRGIDPVVAAEASRVVEADYALGIGVHTLDGRKMLSHGGSNRGYKTGFTAFPELDAAVVAFANHDRGWQIVSDLQRTVLTHYDWPRDPIEPFEKVAVDGALMRRLAGRYAGPNGDFLFTAAPHAQGLRLQIENSGAYTLVPITGDRFIDPSDGQIVTWRFEDDGHVVLMADGASYPRLSE